MIAARWGQLGREVLLLQRIGTERAAQRKREANAASNQAQPRRSVRAKSRTLKPGSQSAARDTRTTVQVAQQVGVDEKKAAQAATVRYWPLTTTRRRGMLPPVGGSPWT